MCVTDRHDMTLAVKVALNPNTTNKPNQRCPKLNTGKITFQNYDVSVTSREIIQKYTSDKP